MYILTSYGVHDTKKKVSLKKGSERMPYLVKERREGKEIIFCGNCGYIFNGYYNFFLTMEKKICPHCGKEIYPSFSDGTFPHIEEKATHIENPSCT